MGISTVGAWLVTLVLLTGFRPCEVELASSASGRSSVAAQATNFTLEGRVTEHVKDRLTVHTEENIVFHVRYDDKTSITRADGTRGSAKDIRVGLKITVEGELTESGEIIAQRIKLPERSDSKTS